MPGGAEETDAVAYRPRHGTAMHTTRVISRGFTLIELVLALAVAAICLGIAIPSVRGAVSAVHAGTAKAAMVEAFTKAIAHSTITGVEVVLCPAGGGDACADTIDWSVGWIAFADLDGNRSRSPNETLLLRHPALADGVHLRGTPGRKRLVFQPGGGAASGSNVTFTLCDLRGAAKATTLVLANSGRFRQDTPDAASAWACTQPL
jgi:type IV fimbrial biogenesis protein FimT